MHYQKELKFQTGWGNLAGELWGEGILPTALALHGWLDNCRSFSRLLPELTVNQTVVALDWAGHGLSDHRPAGSSYSFYDNLLDLDAIITSLGPTQPLTLVGHSLGGALALLYAASCPERVKAVVSIDSLGPMVQAEDRVGERLGEAIAAWREFPKKRKNRYDNFPAGARARALLGGISQVSAEALAQRGLTEIDGKWEWRSDARLRLPSIVRMTEASVQSILRTIQQPVLLIEARQSQLEDVKETIQLRKPTIKNLRTHQVEAGHHVHLDLPNLISESVDRFLATHG